ncbi:hypothetical protein ACF08M_38915 [Streptomyces sp. NPDC015032]|uniref:hypothetical protein n=1 Tax=Streptomyces sp. NPDC015032 TaxID=3364937 RepID=UPI0036F65CC9
MAFVVWGLKKIGVDEPDKVGALIGVPIGVIGLVIAVVALRKPAKDNGAELARSRAKRLAELVENNETGEAKVLRQLLGDDTPRINLTYVLQSTTARVAAAPPAGHTFDDGVTALPDVLEYYRSTRPRRLVVTGAAGAERLFWPWNSCSPLSKTVPRTIPSRSGSHWPSGTPNSP